jgi:hypothetical protein
VIATRESHRRKREENGRNRKPAQLISLTLYQLELMALEKTARNAAFFAGNVAQHRR